jgi:hypothetical protein
MPPRLKRAYTKDGFVRMAEESGFGTCQVNTTPVALEVQFTKPRHKAACFAPAVTLRLWRRRQPWSHGSS